MNTNTKTIVAFAAVVAISAILVGSVLAEDAMAKRCHYRSHNGGDRSVHQAIAQSAISNGNGDAQNTASQIAGNDNAVVVTGNQN